MADFGGFTAGEILFERKSSAGDSAEGEGTREEIATDAGASIDSAIGDVNTEVIAFEDRHDEGVRFMMGGKTNTLTAAMGTGGNNVPLIKTIAIEGNGSRPSHKGNGYKETDKMYTLNATEVHGVGVFPQQAFDEYGEGKPLSTLKAQGGSYGGQ